MNIKTTDRGFTRIEFTDYDGVKCHLQESSLATDACIRIGCSELGLIHLPTDGTGWQPVKDLPPRTQGNTSMHLTQDQVARLLPYLLEFILFGTVGDVDNETDALNRCTEAYKSVLVEAK